MRPLVLTLAIFASAGLAEAKNLYVPVAGVAQGANNTRFRTDVRIFNPSPIETIGISVHFLPQGMDGSNISGILVPVGPGEMVVLNDIAGSLFQLAPPALGAIRFDSDVAPLSYPFVVTSRTYTDSPNPAVSGTYGQFIPALDPQRDAHLISIVLHISHSNDLSRGSRTNAGIMNPNRVPAVVTPTVVRADGTLIAEGAAITVPAMSMVQQSIPDMFGTDRDVENGYLHFISTQPVFTYASVIDNNSGDQFFIVGAKDDSSIETIP